VTRAPACIAGNALDVFPVEAGRLSRTQLPRNDHDLFGQMSDILALFTEQLFEQTPFNIVDVRRSLAHIGVFLLGEMRRNFTQDGRYGVLCRHRFGVNHIRHLFSQASVVQETQMHRKNIFYLAASAPIVRRLKPSQFADRILEGISRALNLNHPLRRLN
jgi:hypothetical protein